MIFDFDGIILETEAPQYQAWQEIYQENGCSLPITEWSAILGSSSERFDPVNYLEVQAHATFDRQSLETRQVMRCRELMAGINLMPGVVDYLEEAKRMGLRMAVASSSPREWVVGHLTAYEILPYFSAVFTANDVERVKPDPMLFTSAAKALEVQADEALIFEDSPNGILAARGAGIFCVAVPNDLTVHLDLSLANYRIPSFSAVPLKDLLTQLDHHNGEVHRER
ncbi:MAG TPA: HAD family hydrolase [Anaerolineaceae bacterium]|nr:HAD family hydrolase [Anaerolineaceae bacterium]